MRPAINAVALHHPALSCARPAPRLSPHPPLQSARQRGPQGQCRTGPRTSRGPDDGRTGGTGRALRSEATMPVLRRSHGRHRDPQAHLPGARAASPAPASRNGGVVIRHGQPQLHVEALPLRRLDGRASRPSESGTAAPITPQPHHLPARHRAIDASIAHPRASLSRESSRPPRSCHLRACTGFLKTP